MSRVPQHGSAKRYAIVTEHKAGGATYTPKVLADFVAQQIVQLARFDAQEGPLRVLDPAVGDGELLVSLLEQLKTRTSLKVEVHCFETNPDALREATARLHRLFPKGS